MSRVRIRAWLGLALFLLACPAWAGDVVRLRGGREVEGKILAITAEVITLQVEQGILRLPREQVLSIHMEQTQVAVPTPLAASGKAEAAEPAGLPAPTGPTRDPEPGEEGWKAPLTSAPDPAAPKPIPTSQDCVPPESPQAPSGVADPDDRIHALLSRYLWLVPDNPSHRISLGAGLLFLATLVFFLAGKLADVEGATFTRSFFLAGCMIGLGLLQATLLSHAVWPVLVAVGLADVVFWYGISRLLLGATLWKSTVMLASANFAVLLGVLWLEVMGYVLYL